jgi:hypothetical protein
MNTLQIHNINKAHISKYEWTTLSPDGLQIIPPFIQKDKQYILLYMHIRNIHTAYVVAALHASCHKE